MNAKRASGVLLHPTSLPSPYGIGDLGAAAYEFIDFLQLSGQKLWQILPLGPVGYGESPYQSFSAFAGNPLLISLDQLVAEGLLTAEQLAQYPSFSWQQVDYPGVKPVKEKYLAKAFEKFKEKSHLHDDYQQFQQEHSCWLDEYCLFMALKKHFGGVAWNFWEHSIAFPQPAALAHYKKILAEEIAYNGFLQFIFFRQWSKLKKYANERQVEIIGDLPIFISYDSSDAWANPHLFALDSGGQPSKVAGVPPDYFSETGQLWGNPHYDWQQMAQDDYYWWRQRFSTLLKQVDFIRIDHFRGFEAYWEIPGDATTAVTGNWVKGPGANFFTTIEKHLGQLPLIAEDLGLITPAVHELRNQFNLPGMQVLHFLFEGGPVDVFLGLFAQNTVCYTGTHDNDTTVGWYKKALAANSPVVTVAHKYFQIDPQLTAEQVCWRFITVALESRAQQVIIPMQDLLALDTEGRMNTPGTTKGNWQWRLLPGKADSLLAARLRKLTEATNR